MKIEFCVVGKTNVTHLIEGFQVYEKRLKHYVSFDYIVLPDIKQPPPQVEALKQKEGDLILNRLQKDDFLVLLDEKGRQLSSVQFAQFIENKQLNRTKKLVFQVGGAFGFSEAVYQRANYQLSLSAMTFSHQMIRLFFIEQLYRAFTIIKGEKYHNE